MGLLDGQQALVTGGGSGIGRAACLRLQADGASVAVLDIDGDAAAAVAAELGGAPVVVADVCDREAMGAAVTRVAAELGGLTILVNNAGVGNVKPMHRYSDREYDRIVDVSMRGTFIGIRAAAPVMVEAGGGSIVNMASISGMRPTRGEAPYAASKAAVIALTQSAALEYGPALRVNCVSPGLIETPLTAPLMSDETVRAGFDRVTPLGRVGTAEEVASVIAFLCSDMAAYVTGINIPVDGGSLLPSAQVDPVLSAILAFYD
ncbi:MAG TPA: SDR family NAD(P)-dependent oxidoreductase [Acidimicrobiales bacterium]|jgi:NAD(P)-dependent dehydrogenase (short-subunit alcohol dehydrogenase family)|nr:SDR family NAD(P)-dependent oxidoreductase [Acidimicrobiales bacterium]